MLAVLYIGLAVLGVYIVILPCFSVWAAWQLSKEVQRANRECSRPVRLNPDTLKLEFEDENSD